MNTDVLIVDDEKLLADNTCEYFNMFDVKAKAVYDSATAEAFLKENQVSLVLLDINLPDGSGFSLCKKLRETTNIPILFISARNTDDDKLLALNIGGDDYIEKPYSLGVLLAKDKGVLKRYGNTESSVQGKPDASIGYDDGHIKLLYSEKQLFVDGVEKKLTAMEFKLLSYLIEHRGSLVTKAELFDNVWQDKFTTDGTLNVHIRKLREAIEENPGSPRYIVTVWKEGYKYIPKPSESEND